MTGIGLAFLLFVACGRFGTDDATSGTDAGSDTSPSPRIDGAVTADGAAVDGSSNTCESAPGTESCASKCSGDVLCPHCLAIRDAHLGAKTGFYRVTVKDEADDQEVYCDMDTAGGGWTMMARTADQEQLEFGWLHGNAKARDLTASYTLDLEKYDGTATEILFGTRGATREWGNAVWSAGLPSGFIELTDSSVKVTANRVKSDCSNQSFVVYVGYTAKDALFYFSSTGSDEDTGLFDRGWSGTTDCQKNGGLEGPGMIFVR